MNKEKANALFIAFFQHNPDPRCALHYSDDFSLLVSIILSAQSTDVCVNKISPQLFAAAPTPYKMLALGQKNLEILIHATGFYRRKAELLLTLCQQLVTRHAGKVPADEAELQALSGVGRKSANVFLNVFYGRPTIGVDRHVFRVARRLGLASGNTPERVEQELMHTVPDQWKTKAAHWLVLHGRTVCKAQRPKCNTCFVRFWCEHPELRE